MGSIINWSEVSRLLTDGGDRTRIGANYRGKRYKRKVERLKRFVDAWVKWAIN